MVSDRESYRLAATLCRNAEKKRLWQRKKITKRKIETPRYAVVPFFGCNEEQKEKNVSQTPLPIVRKRTHFHVTLNSFLTGKQHKTKSALT